MARRWRDPKAFRADPAVALVARPSRRQSIALLTILVLVAGVIAAVSYLIRPERARAFNLFSGSIFLADAVAPVAVDLATGSPSIRLIDATAQVGATPQQSSDLAVTPLAPGGGTLLLNRRSGQFNMVDATGFVIKRDGGVPLPALPHTRAIGLPAHDPAAADLAYIEQAGRGGTRVYLVSQATVRAAILAKHVRPRASAVLTSRGSTQPGKQTSANGDLWLLTGRGAQRTVIQLALPRNSHANGATLRQISHGTVSVPAALGSAAMGPDAARSAVGVASADEIQIFSPDGRSRTVRYAAPPGVDKILATSNQAGRLAFLLHGRTGWSLVTVGTDGTRLRGPTPIANLAPGADLIPPAASGDALYTLDRASGQIWQIGPDAAATSLPGATKYPRVVRKNKVIEPGGWDDTYVIARDDRVFFDSPSHRDALALFTDGSRPPLVIQKSAAVGVNAIADAAALSRSRNRRAPPPSATQLGHSQPPPQQTVRPPSIDNSIDCRTTAQKPHIPQIYGVQPASRSVTFSWSYPRINNQDCVPRTYVVSATLVSGNAPPAPGKVTVEDQQSVTLTGLYPASTYDITVTAVLGSLSTTSKAVPIQTSAQGPAAPTNVQVRTDASGDWILTWDSCGGVAQNCVPSASWQIQPHLCDGHGLVGALTPLAVPADTTTRRQPPAVYHGGTALLGRGLSFQVMGRGSDNLPGTLSAPTPCLYSWAPPVAAALKLTASTPSETAFGTTTTANATLNLGDNPVRDVGGVGAQVTFTLTGNGTTQTKGPIVVDGSQSTVSATFAGITAGARYTATASVQAAHGGSPISITAPPLSTRSTWPNFTINAGCPQSLLSCSLQVALPGVSSAASRGELFSLTNASQIRCNNAALPLNKTGFDPGTSPITVTLSQLDGFYGPNCTVTIQLVEDAPPGTQLVYGGIPSPVQTATVDLGPPAHANVSHDDLNVQWDPQGSSSVRVAYTGNQDLADLTTNWSETVTAPGGAQQCGSAQQSPANALSIPVDPNCVNLYGGQAAPWTVTVQFTNRSDGTIGGPFTYQLAGPPPGYQPCNPQGLSASWGATQADGISVTLGSNADISGCSQWSYALYDGTTTPPTQICSGATSGITGPPPVNIDTTQCSTAPADGWFVQVSWVDTAGQAQQQNLQLGPPPPS